MRKFFIKALQLFSVQAPVYDQKYLLLNRKNKKGVKIYLGNFQDPRKNDISKKQQKSSIR